MLATILCFGQQFDSETNASWLNWS